MNLQDAMDKAVDELKREPENLVETLPDIIYVGDISEEVGCEEDEDKLFAVSPDQGDLVGVGNTALIGIYKLIAVQKVEKYEKVKTLATEFAPPGVKELELDLGTGGATVAGNPFISEEVE